MREHACGRRYEGGGGGEAGAEHPSCPNTSAILEREESAHRRGGGGCRGGEGREAEWLDERGARHTLTQLRHTLPQLRHHTAPTASTAATSLVYRDYMSIPVCMCAAYTTMHIPGSARAHVACVGEAECVCVCERESIPGAAGEEVACVGEAVKDNHIRGEERAEDVLASGEHPEDVGRRKGGVADEGDVGSLAPRPNKRRHLHTPVCRYVGM
jgi:hypothetical protein